MGQPLSQFQYLWHAPDEWSLQRCASFARRRLVGFWLLMTLACVLGGGLVGRPEKPFEEFQIYTFYTVSLMGMSALVCLQCTRLARAGARQLWLLMCIGFAFLAADDLFRIHESIEEFVHGIVGSDIEDPLMAHLNEIVVLTYGLVGITLLCLRRNDVRSLRYFWPGVACALTCFLLMLFLDVRPKWLIENTFAPPDFSNDVAGILEDSFKGLGACLFLWTFIACREQYRTRPQPLA